MLRFSLTMTLRDWRAGELRFLLVALALAVASLSAVGFFADRMGASMQRDAHQLLAADMRIAAQAPIDPQWRARAAGLGLRTAETVELNSMAVAGEGATAISSMVALKGVTEGYPLRGVLTVGGASGTAPAHGVPAPGTVWVDPAVLASFHLAPGATIRLGELRLTITRTIVSEPDRGAVALAFAPRVLIAMSDLQRSGLVQGGSFADHYLLVAGDGAALTRLQTALAASGRQDLRLETLATNSAATGDALARATQFLALIGLLSALLASVAVAMAARRFMLRHMDACAMLRCLGMPLRRVTAMFMIEFALVGLAGSALGVALGFAAHFVLVAWLGTLVVADLAPVSLMPAASAVAVGVLLLTGFALPSLLQLRAVPHQRLLRREAGPPRAATLATYGLGLGMFGALLVWQAGDITVGLLTVAAFAVGMALFSAAAWAALAALRFLPASMARGVWRLALADLRRSPAASATQVVALALGLMALLLLTVVRGDLLASWQDTAPPDAPNHVILNIQPDQQAAIAARLVPYGRPVLYPLIRGRILSIGGKAVDSSKVEEQRTKDLLEREIDMSTASALPPENTLVAGRWFSAGPQAELSLGEGSARALGVKLGERMVLDIAGSRLEATVTSLRKVNWRSRQSNFGFLLNPAAARG
ncbi:MAG TPA: FtsX-like permease family protein, partial [Telluria sp.]